MASEDEEIGDDEIEIVTVMRFGSSNTDDQGLPLSTLGMEVMKELAELLQSWPNCYPSSSNSRSDPGAINYARQWNLEFLTDLLADVQVLDALTVPVQYVASELLETFWQELPPRLAYAILLSNEDDLRRRCNHLCRNTDDHEHRNHYHEHQHECLMCDKPRVQPTLELDDESRAATVDMEVRNMTINCGQWILSTISLLPGIPMDEPRYCRQHFLTMREMFHRLMSNSPLQEPAATPVASPVSVNQQAVDQLAAIQAAIELVIQNI